MISQNAFSATVYWCYVAEITVDKGMGISLLTRMVVLYIWTFVAIEEIKAMRLVVWFYFWAAF